MPRVNKQALILIACVALAGVIAMLIATRYGIGIDPDSTVYLDASRNLLRGFGLSVLSGRNSELIPLTHYPPLYPALLALIGTSGMPLESAARLLNAVLLGANVFLVGLAISFYSRDSFWLPVLGSVLTLTAVDIAGVHSFALTEPLFVFLVLAGLICLASYLERQQGWFLVVAAVALALSLLTRYVGVVSLITGCFALLVCGKRPSPAGRDVRRRLLDTLLFGAIASMPTGLWAIRNHLIASGATDRQFVFHPPKMQQFVSGFSTVAQWLLLGKVPGSIRAIGFMIEVAILVGVAVYLKRKSSTAAPVTSAKDASELPQILGIFIAVYVAFLIFTASFIDADTVFDSRSLIPVHVTGIILVFCLAGKSYIRSNASRALRIVLIVMALLLVASHSFRWAGWLVRTSKDGQGYASRSWTQSETIAAVKNFSRGIPIYSNGYDAIYYLTGRRAIPIPEKVIHSTGRPNQNYEREVEQMANEIREHNGVLVYFHTLPERTYLPSEDELRRRLPLYVNTLRDGLIFEVNIYERVR